MAVAVAAAAEPVIADDGDVDIVALDDDVPVLFGFPAAAPERTVAAAAAAAAACCWVRGKMKVGPYTKIFIRNSIYVLSKQNHNVVKETQEVPGCCWEHRLARSAEAKLAAAFFEKHQCQHHLRQEELFPFQKIETCFDSFRASNSQQLYWLVQHRAILLEEPHSDL